MNTKIHLIKTPSAWLPIAMSTLALIMVIIYVSIFGITQQPDEGVAARIFQLLLAGQIPIIAFFAYNWLPKNRKQASQILMVQFFAGMLTFAVVYLLQL